MVYFRQISSVVNLALLEPYCDSDDTGLEVTVKQGDTSLPVIWF